MVVLALVLPSCSTSRHGDDAGVDGAVGALDPVGVFHTCNQTWTFAPTGTLQVVDRRADCTASGTWTIVGGSRLTLAWETDGCGVERAMPWVGSALRNDHLMTLQRDGDGGPTTLVDGSVFEVEAFTFVDDVDPTRRTVASLVRTDATDGINGCYWSEDRSCGGLFSCTGRILQWRPIAGGAISVSTACQGDCPCGAVLTLTADDGGYAIDYEGVNCEGTFSGTAHAEPLPAP